ncbi:MAG: virulence RhuM family protein [Muribaculaceae bacterium]|nr:virulence RhuM family protein [Muribaculaceae bacterium]
MISVGYRVNSQKATKFSQWATRVLNEFIRKGSCFSGRCLRVRPYNGIDSSFLYYYLNTESFKSYIRNVAVGCTMPSLNTSILEEIPVWLPDYKELHNMGIILEAIASKLRFTQFIFERINITSGLYLPYELRTHIWKIRCKGKCVGCFCLCSEVPKERYVIGVGSGAGLWSG